MGKQARKIRQTFTRIARYEVDNIRQNIIENKPKLFPTFLWMKLIRFVLGDSLIKGIKNK